jgi:hypothetical protein
MAFRVSRRRPLLLSPDVALARRAFARMREQALQVARGSAMTSVGGWAIAQYATMLMLLLWQGRVSVHPDFLFAFPYIFAYLGVSLACIFVGTIVRSVGTYQAQPAAPVTSLPRRSAGNASR